MRVDYFIVAGASLSINLFTRSVIGVTDLRQRDGTKSADRNVIRAGPPGLGSRPEPPEILPQPLRPPEGSGAHSPANGGSGSGSAQGNPDYAPAPKPNSCLKQGSECEDIMKKASELVKEVAKKLADAGGSTTTTSGTFATVITPAPVPNYDVITAINMKGYLPLLNTAEQQMWRTDPLCFFANIEGYYTAAASSSAAASTTPATTSSAAASTTPSSSSDSPSLSRRNQLDSIIAGDPTTTSTLPPLSFSSLQSVFFSYYMPSALVSAYGAPRNGSLSTATTTCSGLHSSGSVTATYVVKAATTTTTGTGGTPSPTISGGGRRSRISVAGAGFLGGWVALLMM